ncbi:MAG: extracellular solute-binding protein [Chloroflexota bacterium]
MSELRFSQYINSAFNEMQTGTDSITALQEAEVDAVETLQAMDDTEVNLTVTSGLPLEIGAGEVVLSFGFQSFIQPLPNQAEWDEAIAGFVAQDPQVGAVDLDIINIAQSLLGSGDTETYDCTYYPNTLFVDIDSELLLPLDPLIFSDPNYDVADLPFGALELTQLNGITYGLPITIQPQMLQYNPDTFAQAGVPEPIGGWTISEFGDALAALDDVLDDDVAPFTSLAFDNTYLLMLVASQGGLPIDTRTNPPTLDFTSDTTLSAVELVLEWVDAGYIDQTETGGPGGGGAGFVLGSGESPITPTFFTGFSNPDLNFTTYPSGSTFTPLAFDVGAGYISIDSDIPEACFRWLSYISRQPELFTGAMPAQVSLIDRPEVQESLGQDTLEAYRTIASQMNEFNVINFNATDPFLTTWLTRAMETYLAEDIELRPELEDAQLYTSDYLACTANIELELNIQLFQDLTACVEQVDAAIID